MLATLGFGMIFELRYVALILSKTDRPARTQTAIHYDGQVIEHNKFFQSEMYFF